MRMLTCWGLSCLALVTMTGSATQAASLPQTAVDALQKREQQLSHLSFNWKLTDREQHIGLPPEKLQAIRLSTEKQLEADYRRRGMTDEKRIKQDVSTSAQNILSALQGNSVEYSNTWHFERDGETTLVTGAKQNAAGMVMTFRQFYKQNVALTTFDSDRTTDGSPLPVTDPVAWKTPGASVRFPSPVMGLDLLPEHFTALVGLNPLAARNVQWTMVSETPQTWVLETHLLEQNAPTKVRMTLNRERDGAPSAIQINQGSTTQTFRVQSFRRYESAWIADKVEFTRDVPSIVTERQVWDLQQVKPVQAVVFDLTQNRPVHDYRLLGENLTSNQIHSAEVKQSHQIVYYRWSGQIPSEEELRRLQSKDHPGEAAPDPGKSASLPFIGGLMALVGGVWMFKRRGNGVV